MRYRSKGNLVKLKMATIGYARISTGDQNLGAQIDALNAAGYQHIFEVYGTGAHFRSLGDPIDRTGPSGVLVIRCPARWPSSSAT